MVNETYYPELEPDTDEYDNLEVANDEVIIEDEEDEQE